MMERSQKFPPNLRQDFTGVEVRSCKVGYSGANLKSSYHTNWYAQRLIEGLVVRRGPYRESLEAAEKDAEAMKPAEDVT